MTLYPESTRFHPTFAYEMIWNFMAAALLLFVSRRFAKKIRPGTVFLGWLVLEGVGRFWIEWFRPDQPRIPGTEISYSRIAAGVMAVVGMIWLLVKYQVIKAPFLSAGREEYQIAPAPQAAEESET